MRVRREAGYTLVELMVVILIFSVVMTLISVSFNRIVVGSGQLLKSTETEIGGLIGLELMRLDLEFAGFGLPWQLTADINYSEAKSHLVDGNPDTDAATFNDSPNNPPRAFVTQNNKGFNGSDYLVLKGSALGMTKTARAWSYLNYSSTGAVLKKPKEGELAAGNGDRVIVLNSGVRGGVPVRDLVSNQSSFALTFDTAEKIPGAFLPQNREDRYLVYGIAEKPKSPDDKINFPFNRAEYYVGPPSDPKKFSSTCAQGTGVLYRGMVNQNGNFNSFPILDCVADLQAMFLLDSNGDGVIDMEIDDIGTLSAEAIREQVKEVRVYILAQQGKKDSSYSSPEKEILVGEPRYSGYGSKWNESRLLSTLGADWMHYRWKVYTIVVQPKNLM